MKSTPAHRLSLAAVFLIIPIVATGQLTIDATGPVRERHRNADVARGGGVGRPISLVVAVQTHSGSPDANGDTEVDFVLTNFGKVDLAIPISPNPGDLEPVDPKAEYTVECLTLHIAHAKKPGEILPGGVSLYGRPDVSGTLKTLAPGDSIKVLTLVALPSASQSKPSAEAFVGTAVLSNETIKTVGGTVLSELQEIGSATSREFALGALSRPPI